jgi:hypothetical protein
MMHHDGKQMHEFIWKSRVKAPPSPTTKTLYEIAFEHHECPTNAECRAVQSARLRLRSNISWETNTQKNPQT